MEAIGFLRVAYALHEARGDDLGRARDLHQIAGAWFKIGEYGRALDAANLMREIATRIRDARLIVYADIARTDVLRGLGDLTAAEASLREAADAAVEPRDRVLVGLKQGVLYIDAGHAALAGEPVRSALAIEQAATSPRPTFLQALWLNLAAVDRFAGKIDDALAKIETARKLGVDEMSYRLARGHALAAGGRLTEATIELTAAEAAGATGEWTYEVPLARARVAARSGDLETAIGADRRAIEQAVALATGASADAPAVAAYFREAYLHLVGVYAKLGRWTDALDVVAALDGQAWLASRAAPTESRPTLIAAADTAPRRTAPRASAADIARAWRGRPLVIAVPDDEHLWRLIVRDGAVSGSDLGAAAPLIALARSLEADPTATDAGRSLGEALLSTDLPAGRVDLLLIGPIARVPLGALRFGDAPAAARWQVARVLGVLPREPSAVSQPHPTAAAMNAPAPVPSTAAPLAAPGATPAGAASARAVVLGDPTGDLPASADEATRVARSLGASLHLGAKATRAALATARGAAVLHIASHAHLGTVASVLQLSDGDVGGAELTALDPPPRLVVLASCASAAGSDDAGNGSLALAFVNAGAELVIATQRSVRDADAAQIMQAFYAAGGASDPIRALAATQAKLAAAARDPSGAAPAWAAFEVIAGRPVRQ